VQHQYVERHSGRVCTEELLADPLVRWLYHPVREHAPSLFRLFTGARASAALAFLQYDSLLARRLDEPLATMQRLGIDVNECLEAPQSLRSPRQIFERKLRFEECRPMVESAETVVSPADARVLVGSLKENFGLFIKGKFFDLDELLGEQGDWRGVFAAGDFAIFRLTPDKYHYNHTPVAGRVIDIYGLDGCYHACNPAAMVREVTSLSRNRRVVTIIDTDLPGGSGVGLVAMIEVVALMIGRIEQCYSSRGYADPQPVEPGLWLEKGQPKSLYHPGSSTDILLFEPGRVRMASDLLDNQQRSDVFSRFSAGFGLPLVETELTVRSPLAFCRRRRP